LLGARSSSCSQLQPAGLWASRLADRVEETLAALEPVSVSRDGKVGSQDPIYAVDEGLREFPSDEILLAGRSEQIERIGVAFRS